MACILLIESSTQICSVAVSDGGKPIWNKENMELSSHSALLGVYVEEAIKFTESNNMRLDAVAVSEGPGSYTGLRIGVSVAKGICYGLDIPLIALSTLKIMASGLAPSSSYLCPMIDARRMEVYSAIYDGNLNEIEPVQATVINEDSFKDILSENEVLFFGNGSEKFKSLICSKNAKFADHKHPLSANMAELAENAYSDGVFGDIAYFEPFYLKDFQATTPKNKIIPNINKSHI